MQASNFCCFIKVLKDTSFKWNTFLSWIQLTCSPLDFQHTPLFITFNSFISKLSSDPLSTSISGVSSFSYTSFGAIVSFLEWSSQNYTDTPGSIARCILSWKLRTVKPGGRIISKRSVSGEPSGQTVTVNWTSTASQSVQKIPTHLVVQAKVSVVRPLGKGF